MFEHDAVNTTEFGSTKDAAYTYVTWLEALGVDAEDFPFKLKTGRLHKGKEIIFTIRSWGSYESSVGTWVVFIAYYYAPMKHLVQYRWLCDERGIPHGNAEKQSWIGV